jgi:hypothetical protein
MEGRTFVKNSFVGASGALLANRGFTAGSPLPQKNIPGIVARSQIDIARFPDGFLWGLASAAYLVEGAWNTDDIRGPAALQRSGRLAWSGHSGALHPGDGQALTGLEVSRNRMAGDALTLKCGEM